MAILCSLPGASSRPWSDLVDVIAAPQVEWISRNVFACTPRAHKNKNPTPNPPPREGCEFFFLFMEFVLYRLSWLSPFPLRVLACGGADGTTCTHGLVCDDCFRSKSDIYTTFS
ncbi:unnamed protein product [Ectocarpus sp. 12 AP-2014]